MATRKKPARESETTDLVVTSGATAPESGCSYCMTCRSEVVEPVAGLIVKSLGPSNASCPRCGALVAMPDATHSIEWLEAEHSFRIESRTPISRGSERAAAIIPLVIAKNSQCSCGAELELSDHKVTLDKSEYALRATYTCRSCAAVRERFWTRFVAALSTMWRDVKKIEITSKGVKFEKTAPKK